VNPPSVRLVDARRAGQSPLGQCADGDQTPDDGVGVLVAFGHRFDKRLVTVGGSLDGVVVIPGQHTRLEWANHLGALADRTHVLGGHGAHTGHPRLAGVLVGLAILAVDRDGLSLTVLNITGPNDGTHCVTFSREKKSYRTCSYPLRNILSFESFDAPKSNMSSPWSSRSIKGKSYACLNFIVE